MRKVIRSGYQNQVLEILFLFKISLLNWHCMVYAIKTLQHKLSYHVLSINLIKNFSSLETKDEWPVLLSIRPLIKITITYDLTIILTFLILIPT